MEIEREAVSDSDLAAERERAIALQGLDPWIEFTCDECEIANRCRLAFDPYNTNGDCLASK